MYLDSSALLRLVLREPGALPLEALKSSEAMISSELLAIECPRTIDRLRLQGSLSIEEASSRSSVVKDWLEAVDLVLLQRPILSRASEPFPTPLGTLDALHLATALVWRDRTKEELVMMTHDGDLATAARAFGRAKPGGTGRGRPFWPRILATPSRLARSDPFRSADADPR